MPAKHKTKKRYNSRQQCVINQNLIKSSEFVSNVNTSRFVSGIFFFLRFFKMFFFFLFFARDIFTRNTHFIIYCFEFGKFELILEIFLFYFIFFAFNGFLILISKYMGMLHLGGK